MRRISIRSLMAFVLVAAVGLAALRNASELWAGIMLLFALAAVGVAILGTALSRGRERAGWLGFVVFGGGYLVVSLFPVRYELATAWAFQYVHDRVGDQSQYDASMSQLIALRQSLFATKTELQMMTGSGGIPSTSDDPVIARLLDTQAELRRRIKTHESRLQVLRGSNSAGLSFGSNTGIADADEVAVNRWRSLLPGAANLDAFQRIGHSLFALLMGVIGGAVGLWFWERRSFREAATSAAADGGTS
jgi:hypothetical protein